MHRRFGFTLLELLVTLAVTAIVLTQVAPAFRTMMLDSRRAAAVNDLLAALAFARSETFKRGRHVVLCPAGDDDDCAGAGAAWQAGWLVFVNTDRDQPPVVDGDEPVLYRHEPLAGLDIRANRAAFAYRPFGRHATNGTVVVCDPRGPAFARAVIVSPTGRPRVAATLATGEPVECAP